MRQIIPNYTATNRKAETTLDTAYQGSVLQKLLGNSKQLPLDAIHSTLSQVASIQLIKCKVHSGVVVSKFGI